MIDVYELCILNGEEEPEFTNLVELAKRTLRALAALFSVIDEQNDRQSFKSATGLGEP